MDKRVLPTLKFISVNVLDDMNRPCEGTLKYTTDNETITWKLLNKIHENFRHKYRKSISVTVINVNPRVHENTDITINVFRSDYKKYQRDVQKYLSK